MKTPIKALKGNAFKVMAISFLEKVEENKYLYKLFLTSWRRLNNVTDNDVLLTCKELCFLFDSLVWFEA